MRTFVVRVLLSVLLLLGLFAPGRVYAQTCDATNLDNKSLGDLVAIKEKCEEAFKSMEAAKKPHVDALKKMESDIAAFLNRIKGIESDLARKEVAIAEGEKDLGNQLDLASRRMRQFYIRQTKSGNELLGLLSSSDMGTALRIYGYQQAVTNEDKKVISQTAMVVKDLEDKKASLEKEHTSLSALKDDIGRRAESVRKLIGEADAYQKTLQSIIARVDEAQQRFIAQKLAGLNLPTSLGAGPLYCTDDRKLDPGFRPAFAFFTFGIPHRVGMNQYGALGRAQAGQSYRDILNAYFNSVSYEKRGNIAIKVQGFGTMPLEQYLLGIYEIPGDWPIEALKAQAVAVRSYALAYTHDGANEICTTQACQVYKGGNKGGNWEAAVKQTEGEVMTKDGAVVTAWFSSTDGGYTFSSEDVGWSSKSFTKRTRDTNAAISGFSDLFSHAYDKDSPCFYSAQGFRSEYAKSAWLKSEEVADITNVILLARRDSGTRDHLYQPDKPNPKGTDSWDRDRVKQELRSRGGTPYNSVDSVSASSVDFGVGKVNQVTISGDGGSISFDGSEFRDYFNIRAPANIQIVGPLFNIERK